LPKVIPTPDGTDLTVSGNNINLTATTDVALAVDTGLLLAGTEKIESDGTDLSITVGAGGDINIGSDIGVTFGDDGEKIEGDGTDLTILSSGVLNLAAGGTTNQIKVTDGAILPITDDDVDLGSATYQFKDVYIDGTLEADAITIGGSAVTAGAGAITALNNATQSELVTVGSTTTELDAEANLTFTGSALTCIGTITVGVDGTGHDVKFFGDTAGSYALWDESADALLLTDSTPIQIGDAQDLTLYHDGTNSYITNKTGALKIATETSGIALTIGHTTSEVTVADNLTTTGNLSVGGNFDVTGTIDLSDSDFTNAGDIQLDSITGDGDTDTAITFSGSDVITITAGGDTQFTFNNGSILPTTDNDIDLGSSSYEFKDGYFDGTLYCDTLNLAGTSHTSIEDPTALAIALG